MTPKRLTQADVDRLIRTLSMLNRVGLQAGAAFVDLADALDAMARFAPPLGFTKARKPPSTCRRIDEHDDLLPGYVAFTRGNGTYGARLRLKALGGRWSPDVLGGVWVIPAEHADAAEANIRLAEKTGQELPLDDTPAEVDTKIRCYVCGKRYTEFEMRTLKHAVPQDWYCGCTDRGAGQPRIAQVKPR